MEVRKAIQAQGYVIHGWRYNATVSLAQTGCSDSEFRLSPATKLLRWSGSTEHRRTKNDSLLRHRPGGPEHEQNMKPGN